MLRREIVGTAGSLKEEEHKKAMQELNQQVKGLREVLMKKRQSEMELLQNEDYRRVRHGLAAYQEMLKMVEKARTFYNQLNEFVKELKKDTETYLLWREQELTQLRASLGAPHLMNSFHSYGNSNASSHNSNGSQQPVF